jgi:CO/xanthine dehydrogenase FAD-binding subunit
MLPQAVSHGTVVSARAPSLPFALAWPLLDNRSTMTTASAEVLLPISPDEAIEAFGDGSDVTVVGGGTILMPELTHGRARPSRVLVLARSGLDRIERDGGVMRIGAATTLETIAADGPEPLRTAAQRIADGEIRGVATLGGNLCAGASAESPRGDLQAPLLALDATVRSAGSGGARIDSVEEFLAGAGAGRLVLGIELAEPERAVYVSLGRPHAHAYTILSVAAARAGGAVRVAAGGVGPNARRLPSVEQALASGAAGGEAAAKALDDVEPHDDALASAWYRRKTLPTLVARALTELGKETG